MYYAVKHDGELLVQKFFRDTLELIRTARAELYGHAWLVSFIECGTGVDDILAGKQRFPVEYEAAGKIRT